MNYRLPAIGVTTLLSLVSSLMLPARAATVYEPVNGNLPPVEREMRAVWIATVENIDWPSKPCLPATQQQAELLAMLDRAAQMHLNAIVLQVRPACDALYASKIEPWSYYVSGTMGKPPEPYYDPLEFAVTEAHKRGLELHAWFNPFRAGFRDTKIAFSSNHISRTHPEMVLRYGKHLWLDPGEKEVQDYSFKVVMDVVRRYDIDGVHFDDYFYPYSEDDAKGHPIDFPDWGSWHKYATHGTMSRDDWRRQNVNMFVERLYESIKAVKPWVKFGVAPFGIWQPHYPQQIKGMNAYNELYCDSRKWLVNGWLDYCAPQLYWAIDPPDQSFPVLFKWWLANNPQHRNIWPGLDSERVGGKWKSDEILNQIKITRADEPGAAGEMHWHMKTLMEDKGGLSSALLRVSYTEPALVPPSPWLDGLTPGKPWLTVQPDGHVSWKRAGLERISVWLLQTKTKGEWRTRILPGETRDEVLETAPDIVALTPIDRRGVAGPAAVVKREEVAQK